MVIKRIVHDYYEKIFIIKFILVINNIFNLKKSKILKK